MTTEHSTYTYEGGEQETVTLRRGTADPHGHALLRIKHDDGKTLDCYVNTAWLRDRLNDLGEPCPVPAAPRALTPDAITDEMLLRFMNTYDEQVGRDKPAPTLNHFTALRTSVTRNALTAALTEPPARPEGAEGVESQIEQWLYEEGPDDSIKARDLRSLADFLAERGVRAARRDEEKR